VGYIWCSARDERARVQAPRLEASVRPWNEAYVLGNGITSSIAMSGTCVGVFSATASADAMAHTASGGSAKLDISSDQGLLKVGPDPAAGWQMRSCVEHILAIVVLSTLGSFHTFLLLARQVYSRNEGSKCSSMTWRAIPGRPCVKMGGAAIAAVSSTGLAVTGAVSQSNEVGGRKMTDSVPFGCHLGV